MKVVNLTLTIIFAASTLFAQQVEQRYVEDFSRIVFEGRGDLVLTPAARTSFEVEAEDGIDLDRLKTYVRGSTLHIEYDSDGEDIFNMYPKMKIFIDFKSLEELSCYGVISARSTEPIVSPSFHFEAEGMGSNRLEVETDRLSVEIAGTASLYLAGTARRELIVLEGTGNVDAFDLVAEEVAAEINGIGSLYLNATESLFVEANGFGAQVEYKGDPEVKDINKNGWVKIKKVASN